MGFNFFTISCLLLAVIPTAFSAGADDNTGDHYIDQTCEGSPKNLTHPYAANLNNVINDLVANTSLNNGYMSSSKGNGSDNAYGFALCRHDVSAKGCNNCLTTVSTMIKASCHLPVATIWHDHCLLSYSRVQDENRRKYPTFHKISDNSEYDGTFKDRTLGLFYKLVGEVAIRPEALMFASGNATYGNERVYAMVQCTRDELVEDYTTYLVLTAFKELKACLPKKGGRIYSGRCIMRYEMFPFTN